MDPGVELDLARRACPLKQNAQLIDHRRRCQLVVLGAGDVEFTLDLPQ